jgi:HPr kinase/phosphorylase
MPTVPAPAPPIVIESKAKVKQVTHVSVGDFVKKHGHHLQLELQGSDAGLARKVLEPSINRPGLALAGYYDYFAYKRIQVIGNSEFSYLNSLQPLEQRRAFRALCDSEIPCVVTARGRRLADELIAVANDAGISVFHSAMNTMKFINAGTLWLEWEFAPQTSEHGCMVDVRGIGILIRGESGVGKSEAVLGLMERGASLVADDKVMFRAPESRELIGSSNDLGRYHMEVRGVGIVNVPLLFGVASMRVEKRLDLVVNLKPLELDHESDRMGTQLKVYRLLGVDVPYMEIPVSVGRDTSRLVEIAALEQKARSFGHHSAVEFNKKLLKMMDENRIK